MAKARKQRRSAPARADIYVILIGLFKLVKGLLLVAVGISALRLLNRDVGEAVTNWVSEIRIDPGNLYIHKLLVKVGGLDHRKLEEISIGSFIYAAVFLTEGIGLILRKRWAEYFTVITTSSLLPLEIYELTKRFTWVRVGLLVFNIVVVWYLVSRLRKK